METTNVFLTSITEGVTTAISFAGDVFEAVTSGDMKIVLGVIGLSIGIAVVGWGVRTLKSLVWGM